MKKIVRHLFLVTLATQLNYCYPVIDLKHYEKKIFSQNGEDGVTEKIFSLIGTTNRYYVEFGVEDGKECNTRFLRERFGWQGLLMDGGYADERINLKKEFITAENINQLFEKYNVPEEFDLLSIDIDFNDFYVWKALQKKYRPRVVIIEYNATHLPTEDKVCIYNSQARWDKTNYSGASLLALYKLAKLKGYSLVYAEKIGVNLFFIRDDVVAQMSESFDGINQPLKIYKKPKYGRGPNGGHPKDKLKRRYVESGIR